MPGEAVDKGQRQFGERADVEVDHAKLFVSVEIGRRAGQPETGIVDHDRGLEAARRKLRRNARNRVALFKIDCQHRRPRPPGGGDFVGKCDETVFAPRDQDEFMAISRKNARQFRADAGRGAGDERDRFHVSPPTRRRSAMRSFADTPSRSAARQIRLSSSSSRWPSA